MDFENKTILIIGLGISNVAIIKYIFRHNPKKIIVTDLKDKTELSENILMIKDHLDKCELFLGAHFGIPLESVDLAIKSPSIPDTSKFIREIRDQNIPIETDITLFFKLITSSKIIGITGTKGKSTTSSLIYSTLKSQGVRTTLCGNIGTPVFEKIEEALNAQYIILEISSFMSVYLYNQKLSPHVTIVTSLSPDHLDYHGSYENYVRDKLRLFSNRRERDLVLICSDSKELVKYTKKIHERNISYYSYKDIDSIFKTSLRGKHYLSNIAAAYCVCKFILQDKFDHNIFTNNIENFKTLPSRMETIRVINNIEFINNSKATNPAAFYADLKTLIEEKASIYLLCGGADKNLELNNMAKLINNIRVKSIALFDEAGTHRLLKIIDKSKVLGLYKNMEEAVEAILHRVSTQKQKRTKVIVILMPGTGSYGLFRNKQGSNSFNHYIRAL